MKLVTKILIALLVLFLVYLGFLRDYVFKNLNAWIGEVYYKQGAFQLPNELSFLKNYSYNKLSKLKWILTFACTLIYLAVDLAIIKLIFKEKKYLMITIYSYIIFVVISAVCYKVGAMVGKDYYGYSLSRVFMHTVQSPLVLMMLIPAFMLSNKQK